MIALNLKNLVDLPLDQIDWQGRQRTDWKDEMETGKKGQNGEQKGHVSYISLVDVDIRRLKELSWSVGEKTLHYIERENVVEIEHF